MYEHLINDLRRVHGSGHMMPTPLYSALYVDVYNGKVLGITGSYFNYSFNSGTAEFIRKTDFTLETFQSNLRVYDLNVFYGCQIDTVN